MKNFTGMYAKSICDAIRGWDRIRFRGTIRWLASTPGINSYLSTRNILLKNFGKWAESISAQVRSLPSHQPMESRRLSDVAISRIRRTPAQWLCEQSVVRRAPRKGKECRRAKEVGCEDQPPSEAAACARPDPESSPRKPLPTHRQRTQSRCRCASCVIR